MTSSLISQAVDFTLATNETNVCGIRKATITSMMVLSRDCDGEARERGRVRVPACYYSQRDPGNHCHQALYPQDKAQGSAGRPFVPQKLANSIAVANLPEPRTALTPPPPSRSTQRATALLRPRTLPSGGSGSLHQAGFVFSSL